VVPDYTNLKDALVAFIDILGFSQDVRAIHDERSFYRVASVLAALRDKAAACNKKLQALVKVSMTAISDSVILSIPYSDPHCAFALMSLVQRIQYDLLLAHQRLARGYIARGPIYHRDGLVFGAGYLDAYMGEEKGGGPPRVVVDPALIDQARRVVQAHKRPGYVSVFELLRSDPADGSNFIDYLRPIGVPIEVLRDEREQITAFVDSALRTYREDSSIHEKYRWLRDYLHALK